jgi:FkbM family methyltransferase
MSEQAGSEMSEKHAPFGTYAATGLVLSVIETTRALPGHWLGKRLGFLLRRIAIKMLGGNPVDTQSLGANFRLYPYNNVCEKRILFSPKDFDETERNVLKDRMTSNFVFLDVGANIGGYSLAVAAMAGSGARIIAVEPQPEIFDRLVFNIGINPFGTIKAMDIAVADRDGELILFLDPNNKGEASVKIVNADHAGKVKVSARPLLAILTDEGFAHVDALKLDVEGAEDIILQRFFADAPDTLWPKLIIIERGNTRWNMDLIGLLNQQGYRPICETRNNYILTRDV